jgi:hypothetical protein
MRRGSHGEIYSLPDKNLREISVNAGKDDDVMQEFWRCAVINEVCKIGVKNFFKKLFRCIVILFVLLYAIKSCIRTSRMLILNDRV